MCYPIQIIMMEQDTIITIAGWVCYTLPCNLVQYTVFPLETLAAKEGFTIPVEILINLPFATNKPI